MKNNGIKLIDVVLEVNSGDGHPSLKRLLTKGGGKSSSRLIDIPRLDFIDGDRVCVVGRNGNGKTTFMRILSKIYQPTSGSIQGEYHPTTVLASGIGLDDELNVMDNVRYSLLMNGFNRSDIAKSQREILDFCEISKHDGSKLYKYFSTGYKSRISFAIATASNPDALFLDEVLGGGDQIFMEKAQDRVREKIQGSRIAFVATHAPNEMQKVCNKLLLLEQGKVHFFGAYEHGIKVFENYMNSQI